MPEPVTMGAGYVVFTGAVAIGGVITGYFMRKEAEKDARRRAERQRMRRAAQERDARAREAANDVAVRIGHDADAIVTRMREKQQQFSGLITTLNTAIVSHQHSTDELQGIIVTMQDNLTDLINSTEAMTLELTQLRDKLKTVTAQLEETRAQLVEKDKMMREAVDSITRRTEGLSMRASQSIEELQQQMQTTEEQTPHHLEVTTLRAELLQSRKQNQQYLQKISELTEINRRQLDVISKFSPHSIAGRVSNQSSPAHSNRLQRPKAGSLFDKSGRRSPSDIRSHDTSTTLSSSLPTKLHGKSTFN